MLTRNIEQRIKALQHNLEDINVCRDNLFIDTYAACGLEYDKSYSVDDMNKIYESEKELKKKLEDRLFTSIFNFTQTYYSIKEYLVKEYLNKKTSVENFFSNAQNRSNPRKNICNDLKHNPKNDLKFETRELEKKSYIEGNTHYIKIEFRETLFYDNVDSVEFCNALYNDLIAFIHKNFNN
jgi:hypothetical protein